MKVTEIKTASPEDTQLFAAKLAAQLVAPKCILLEGDLGAGKTTFVQGFVHGLRGGGDIIARSPTYALARTYATEPPLHHIDLYRLEEEGAAWDLGLMDMAQDDEALCCIEWPERAPSLQNISNLIRISIHDGQSAQERLIRVEERTDKS